jgi:hypothetical protein
MTTTDSKAVSYVDAVRQFEDGIAMEHIVHFVEWLAAVHEPHAIAPEQLVERLFQHLGLEPSHPVTV